MKTPKIHKKKQPKKKTHTHTQTHASKTKCKQNKTRKKKAAGLPKTASVRRPQRCKPTARSKSWRSTLRQTISIPISICLHLSPSVSIFLFPRGMVYQTCGCRTLQPRQNPAALLFDTNNEQQVTHFSTRLNPFPPASTNLSSPRQWRRMRRRCHGRPGSLRCRCPSTAPQMVEKVCSRKLRTMRLAGEGLGGSSTASVQDLY